MGHAIRGNSLNSTQSGMALREGSDGTTLRYDDPQRTYWCFVRNVDDEHGTVVISEARRTPIGKWVIYPKDVRAVLPAPGYTIEDFRSLMVKDQPTPADRAVAYTGAYVWPVGGGAVRMLVLEIRGDYLICVGWDGVTRHEEEVIVAKPSLLRRTPFDGETIYGIAYVYHTHTTRTATQGSETEDQIVIPRYRSNGGGGVMPGETITAMNVGGGATGATFEEEDPKTEKPVQVPIAWLDMNVDARAWAKQFL